MTKCYRILVVDECRGVYSGIKITLESEPDEALHGEGAKGLEVVDLARRIRPDLILLNHDLHGPSSSEMNRRIRENSPQTKVQILTIRNTNVSAGSSSKPDDVAEAVRVSAEGVVTDVIRGVQQRTFLPANQTVAGIESHDPINAKEDIHSQSSLTVRETEVLTLLAKGQSNRETATSLGMSARTVESHRIHIMRKMNFSSYSHLIRFAVRNALINP